MSQPPPKWNPPEPDEGQAPESYLVKFTYGDFKQVSSQYSGTEFQTSILVEGEPHRWYCGEGLYLFLIDVARQDGSLVQVNDRQKEAEGIRKGAEWYICRSDRFRWHVWPKGADGPEYDSNDFGGPPADQDRPRPGASASRPTPGGQRPQQQQPARRPNPGPPGPEPPPPQDQAPPPVTDRERQSTSNTGITPGGSAPPRIARSAQETNAIMDLALTNAVRLAKKHKPHVAHIDAIAEALFTSYVIGGLRVSQNKAAEISAELVKMDLPPAGANGRSPSRNSYTPGNGPPIQGSTTPPPDPEPPADAPDEPPPSEDDEQPQVPAGPPGYDDDLPF